MTETDVLVLEGTDPTDWPEFDAATLDRMAGVCSDATLARMAGVCSAATLDRMAKAKQVIESVAPVQSIYSKILNKIESGGKLKMSAWHTCETTHCIGGWAVTLAGEIGRGLERRFSTETAARFIFRRSAPNLPLPNFYASDKAAMAFIRKMAEAERKG